MNEFPARPRSQYGATASPVSSMATAAIVEVLMGGEGLRVVLQPQADLANRRVIGAEALTRWHHPQLGEIPASVFIPAVEHLGLHLILFHRVLAQVIRILLALKKQGCAVPISVNASANTLLSPGLARDAARQVSVAGLPTDLVRVELTEEVPISDPATLVGRLNQFTARGFELAMDDFGVGISTMQLLTQISFSELKIDRQFVRRIRSDPASRAVTAAAINLGRTLGMRVVAEGIEDVRDIPVLREMGCEIGQGYALHRPLEINAFLALMHK